MGLCSSHPSAVNPEVAAVDPEIPQSVIVVDPFSTGVTLAEQLIKRGYACICVYSNPPDVLERLIQTVPQSLKDQFADTMYHCDGWEDIDSVKKTAQVLRDSASNIVAVFIGAETGVELGDALAEVLNLRTNGFAGSKARRDKFLMGEKIRQSGLRAVKQSAVTEWSQIDDFVANTLKPTPFTVVVKPIDSSGTDGVSLCQSMDEVKSAFERIQGQQNVLGLPNKATLVQEYLEGTEYVVDTVSRDGKHKVAAVWEYDKRPVNSSAFVYFGVILRPAAGDLISALIAYIFGVLDALEIMNGPSHAEVKWVNGEPCLIEIGSRCHGGGGSFMPIVNECIGYNQVDMTIDAYMDPDSFDRVPDWPVELRGHGGEVVLVSYDEGTLLGYPGLSEIESMPSYVSQSLHLQVGETLKRTTDLPTSPGTIQLIHQNEAIFSEDYNRILELEHDGLYACDTA